MEKIRALILAPDLPDPIENIKGGIQSAVLNLLIGFESHETEILVLSISKSNTREYEKQISPNVKVVYMPEGPSRFSFINFLFYCSKRIRQYVAAFDPHVIHFEEGMNFLLIRVGAPRRDRHILTVHGITFAEARLKRKFLQRMKWYQNGIVEWLLLPRHIIHISDYSKNVVPTRNKNGLPIIFNAVASRFFTVAENESTNNNLLYVGVINERKNILMLLEVLKDLVATGKPYCLKVVGDFDMEEDYHFVIRNYVREHQLEKNVRFLGWCSQQELLDLYTDADVVVLPSLQETLPVVIAETMAAGRVMVATAIGGIPEMITHQQNGFLFQPGNNASLYEILFKLHNNHRLIEQVGAHARITATIKFHCEAIAAKTVNYYRKIAGI